jgi:hypothetical protein
VRGNHEDDGALRKMRVALSVIFACLLSAATPLAARATVSVQLDCGALKDAAGSVEPLGGLLQLIASPIGAFSAPTSASFVTGDNVVVLSLPMNFNFGVGETNNVCHFSLASTGTTAGEEVQLRWYPTLTAVLDTTTGLYDPSSTSPGLGSMYGSYRSAIGESNGKGTGTGIAWTIPADSSTLTTPGGWNFVTASNGGPDLDAAGLAILTVVPVPEPAIGVWLGAAALCLLGFRRRKQVSL